MQPITEGNKAFIERRYHEALAYYKKAKASVDPQILSYNIYKCEKEISKHSCALKPFWPYEYYDSEVLNKKITDKKYIAGIASMPSRTETLEKVVANILPQVDEIHIFLNNFDTVPAYLYNPKIRIHRSQEHGDQRDNGKFFGLKFVDSDSYYFTLDDDIHYPRGYINLLASKIISHSNKVAVGVHGVIYATEPKTFFDRLTFNFERELLEDVPVSVLGTGTTGFHTGSIKPPFEFFTSTGMADLFLGAFLKESKIPAICIARPKGWLVEYHRDDRTDTIYHETKTSSTPYDDFLKRNSPWGANLIVQTVDRAALRTTKKTQSLLKFMQDIPHKGINQPIATSKLFDFFACGGIYPFSDEHYIGRLKGIINYQITQTELQDTVRASLAKAIIGDEPTQADFSIKLFDADMEAYNQAIISEYAQESRNPELNLLLKTIEFLQSPADSPNEIIELLNLSLVTGQSNALLSHLPDVILYNLEVDLIFNLLKAAIIEDSPNQEKLLLCLAELDQGNHTLTYLKAMYETRLNSAACESAILKVVKGKYKSRNKVRHLQEIMRLALETGAKILPKRKYEVLLDESIDIPVRRVLLDALMTEGELKNSKAVDGIIKSLSSYGFEEEEARLRIAELKRQTKPKSQSVVTALNHYLKAQGMTGITQSSNSKCFFTGLRTTTKLKTSKDLGLCTVIIAAYNAENTLQYAYDSICSQTYPNIEVIVVDDSNQVPVESYLKVNPTIPTKLVRNDVNQGPYGCRNVAISHMSGAYFVIHDADDWAHPEKIALQIESIHGTEKVCSYARHIRITSDGSLKLENHGSFIGHGPMTSLFKSRVLADLGVFDAVPTRGDMEYKARIKRFYGEHSINEDLRLMLFSLDWHSNSKQKTSSLNKAFKLSQYKNRYSKLHTLAPFMQKNS